MKKNLIYICAVLGTVLCASPVFAQTIKADWLLDEKGIERLEAEMKKHNGKLITVDISKCSVPENKYGQKSIPRKLFDHRAKIKKILFPKEADYIEYMQFNDCIDLEEIVLPQKVKLLSNFIFNNCDSLKKIVMPKIVEDGEVPLSDYFDCDNLEEIIMPENLKWISCKTGKEKISGKLKKIKLHSYPVNILCDETTSSGYWPDYYRLDFEVETPSGKKDYKTFYEECRNYSMALKPKNVYLKAFKSSSALADKYKAENIFSGDWKCWTEGTKGSGEGEWIEAEFSEPTTVYMVSLKNGFGNLAYFWKNNRIKDCQLIFDDDEENPVNLTLADTPECQNFYIKKNEKAYSKMRLVIKSVYKGTDPDDDTCLDELAVNMTFLRASQMEWDVFYSTEEKGYVYDPETFRMLKALFTMDVGESKVGVTKDGRIKVKFRDWETEDEYETVVSGALNGTLFSDFWPGTGGGHRYHKYQIILKEDGNHLLAEWTDYGDGGVAKHPLDDLYIWKNQNWISYKDPSVKAEDYGIKKPVELIDWFNKRNISWDFFVDGNTIRISPRIVEAYDGNYLNFDFESDTKKISDYKKEPANIIVTGSADDLKKIPDWKTKLPKKYGKANMLVVAAAFNPDPSMVKYLIESGYKVNDSFLEKEYYGKQTPLEACLSYDNKAVLQVLLDNGASYSQEILMEAMDRRNLADVEKYAGLVNSYDKVLIHVSRIYSNEKYYGDKDTKRTIGYIKKLIAIFKMKGIDINAYASDDPKGKKQYHSICGDAICTMDLDYIKACVESGCKIPEIIEAYGKPTPVEYAVHEYLSGNDKDKDVVERRKNYKAVIDYLISQGASVNAPHGETEWYTALYEICASDYWQQSRIDMIKFLIEKGIDVNQKGKGGKTAFSAFMNHNKSNLNGNYPKQVFKLLLDNGVETGEELFDISYSKSDFDQQLFDLLFESMKDVTYVSHQKGRTLLTYILETYEIHETSYYALKKILSRDFNMYSKADEETINGKKRTPFRYFIYHAIRSKLEEKKIFELYDLLLKHGANVNEIDSWKTTPFTTVVEEIHENNIVFGFSLAKRLIKDGAKVDVKNRYGKFYLDVLLDRLYYIDEGEIEDSWKNLNREQLDGIIGISRILIENGTPVKEKQLRKHHVPEDVIKDILK